MKKFIGLLVLLFVSVFSIQAEAAVYYRLPLDYVPYPINAWYDRSPAGDGISTRFDGVNIPNYPINGKNYFHDGHKGVDFGVSTGTSVKVAAGGLVYNLTTGCLVGDTACGGGFGNNVKIRHSTAIDSYPKVSISAHLSIVSVALNATVTCGQQVGLSGNTGSSSGPHLHFELWQNDSIGQRIDPFIDYWYYQTFVADPLRPGYTTFYPYTTCYQ